MKTTIGIFAVILMVASNFQAEAQKVKRNSCVSGISNLTEEQKSSITELESSYQTQMADFRTQRQATTDATTKANIREKMLVARNAHQNAVKALLNEDQQKEFTSWQEINQKNRSNKANSKGKRNGKGNGAGNTNGQGQSRAGNGQGNGTCVVTNE
ncbi:hypothetical protein [Mangrovibacterium sp.]|uniref:hypothetical protein n=1 Tax=Mangrovibacterium sp. TaxID=1961364 RepID=UPI00356144B1